MNEDGALFDSGFDDNEPFRVSPESGSVSLESALRDFGPAAIDDLIPRLRAIAASLDAAHRAGLVHGALHPSKVFVSDASTYVIAGKGAHAPYAAPEVLDGHGATPMSDQYALAAIAYEWLFGRPVAHGGERAIEVRSMPGVDRSALSQAFTRALSLKPEDRFASCVAFCDAMNGAIVPELPLLADVDDFQSEDELGPAPIAAAAVGEPASPFADTPFDAEPDEPLLAHSHPNVDDLKIVAEETNPTAGPFDSERDDAFLAQGPELDAIDPRISEPPPPPVVPAWTPASRTPLRSSEPQRFGVVALLLATLVGAVFGFAAGYMARPRALQSGTIAVAPNATGATSATGPTSATGATSATVPSGATGAAGTTDARNTRDARVTPAAPAARVAPAATATGRLLVRSSPSGASVTVDGTPRGVTPLALRELSFGTREVTVARRGYISESVKVAITKARPARTIDVRLSAEAARPASGAAPRPSTPATLGKPAVSTGSLSIESRPTGASVSLNGKPSGTTPLTINDLAPGEYRIVMSMTGYRNVATTVRVVAGERARAAASLTALEQE